MMMDAGDITAGSVLPENHEDQVQLGFRLIQNAYNNKTASLEQEVRALQLTAEEQKAQAAALQRKNSSLEVELVEGHQRSQQLSEENKELFKTVQQLRRQLGRLEGLKRSVLDSINDHQQAEVDHDDGGRLYMRDDYLKSATPLTTAALMGHPIGQVHSEVASVAPAHPSRAESPARSDAYRQPSPPPAPQPAPQPAQEGAAVDGKQFFRKARNNLTYESFNDFLASIKRLNNQQQSREETLEQARRIFGSEQQALYMEFEQLLSRHASVF